MFDKSHNIIKQYVGNLFSIEKPLHLDLLDPQGYFSGKTKPTVSLNMCGFRPIAIAKVVNMDKFK